MPSGVHHSVLYYLLGKTHNVMPDYDSQAQNYLSMAVKLNPSYVEAWNELGENKILSNLTSQLFFKKGVQLKFSFR